MTGDERGRRRVTIRTTHDDPDLVGGAIKPDNTAEMETTVDGSALVTRIERETTGSVHSTVDDYVVNLDVATSVVREAQAIEDTDDADADETRNTTQHS